MDKAKCATFFLKYINNLQVIIWIYNEFGNPMVFKLNQIDITRLCYPSQPPAPPGGTGRGAPDAPRRRPRRNMLRPRRRRVAQGAEWDRRTISTKNGINSPF